MIMFTMSVKTNEQIIAGVKCFECISTHGKFEMVAALYDDGLIDHIIKANIEFCGEHYQFSNRFDYDNITFGDIRDYVKMVADGNYSLEYGEEFATELLERAEYNKMFALVIDYVYHGIFG